MRIISNFRDFYDGAQKQGMDREIVYVRDCSVINIGDREAKKMPAIERNNNSTVTIKMSLLGFCGKIYPFVEVKYIKDDSYLTFFNLDEFKQYAEVNLKFIRWDSRSWWSSNYLFFDRGRDYQTFFTQDFSSLIPFFQKHNVPVFLYQENVGRNRVLVLNPTLKALQFQRVKDVYTTYQDLFQYVAGVLNQKENEMVKISNEDKIAKHGFDKYSFKKLPGNKKRKKSKKK